MTCRQKKQLLKKIYNEWKTDSIDSHIRFEEQNRDNLEFLYVNGYLKKDFYTKSPNVRLEFYPGIRNPLNSKGERYIHKRFINKFLLMETSY